MTGESFLQPSSTSSGTNNRNLFMTPSMMLGQKLVNAPGHLTQAALGRRLHAPGVP